MDTRKLIELLRATIDPNQRQQSEEQLSQVCRAHVAMNISRCCMTPAHYNVTALNFLINFLSYLIIYCHCFYVFLNRFTRLLVLPRQYYKLL